MRHMPSLGRLLKNLSLIFLLPHVSYYVHILQYHMCTCTALRTRVKTGHEAVQWSGTNFPSVYSGLLEDLYRIYDRISPLTREASGLSRFTKCDLIDSGRCTSAGAVSSILDAAAAPSPIDPDEALTPTPPRRPPARAPPPEGPPPDLRLRHLRIPRPACSPDDRDGGEQWCTRPLVPHGSASHAALGRR